MKKEYKNALVTIIKLDNDFIIKTSDDPYGKPVTGDDAVDYPFGDDVGK